jgi:hypothetical protein
MKCPSCETDNKDGARSCKKCRVDLSAPAVWKPTWRWHAKTLLTIYAILIVSYFVVSAVLARLPAPYRPGQIPKELTPWLFPSKP